MSVDVSAEAADLAQGRARWRTAVAGVLAKSTKQEASDVEALGPEPEQMLETPTYEAVAIRALYTALDELPEPPLPGEWPFLRGGDALRDVKSGWKVAEAIPANRVAGVAAEDVNSAVLAALGRGRQRAAAPGGGVRVLPGAAGEGVRGRLPEHGAGDSRRRRRLPRPPARCCWSWWAASTTTSAPSCRSTWAPIR